MVDSLKVLDPERPIREANCLNSGERGITRKPDGIEADASWCRRFTTVPYTRCGWCHSREMPNTSATLSSNKSCIWRDRTDRRCYSYMPSLPYGTYADREHCNVVVAEHGALS